MSASLTAAAAEGRPPRRPTPEPRADRDARRGETAPLAVPVTAAFIGLLLLRDAVWAEESAAETGGEAGAAGGVSPPPAGAEAAGVRTRPGLGDGAQLALGGGGDTAPWGGADAVSVQRLVQQGEATLTGAGDNVFQLGGEGRPIDVTLEGLQLNGMPMAVPVGGAIPEAEAELASLEDAAFEGAGYLAQIENVQLGTAGDDVLTGTDGNDYISGGDGDDTIDGRAGDDTLHGDAGDDTVDGGPGHDNVYGDAGDDDLDGGDGSDDVFGGSGDDSLTGGDSDDSGIDRLYGGFGSDTYFINHVTDDPDEFHLEPLTGDDYGFSDPGLFEDDVDQAIVSEGFFDEFQRDLPVFVFSDSYDQLAPTGARDKVYIPKGVDDLLLEGTWDADIYGGGGDNVLVGNAGDNTIKGFAGDDTLDGRGGTNRLEGGTGADTYLIDTTLDGVDTIVDGDGPDALTANTLRFKGVDRADLAIAHDGDAVTFTVDEVLRARIEGYDADGPVFHVATDDARFDLLGVNHAPRLDQATFDELFQIVDDQGNVIAQPVPEWSPSLDDPELDFEGDLFVDVDLGDDAQVEASLFGGAELPGWLTFHDHGNRFEASPPSEAAGLYVVELTATDTKGLSADASFVLNVGETSPDAYEIAEDTTRTFRPPWDRFSDIDLTSVERVEMTRAEGAALPDWIDFDARTGRFTVQPTNETTGTVTVDFTATDRDGAQETVTFDITGVQVNDAPAAVVGGLQLAAVEDTPFTRNLSADLFVDVDPGDRITLELGGDAPDWLGLHETGEGTWRLEGTPDQSSVGPVDFEIIGRDLAGASDAFTASLVVDAVNDVPEAANVPDMVQYLRSEDLAPEGPYTYQLPADLFTDPDDGDSLTLSARSLVDRAAVPEGFGFDPATGTFRADRPLGDVEPFEVEITATDQSGARGYATITLDVDVVNRPPVLELDERRIDVDGYEKQPFVWEPDTAWFTDPDGDALRFEAGSTDGSALPGWLSVDPETGALEGTPPEIDQADGPLAIELRAIDAFGATSAVHHRSNGEDQYISTPLEIRLHVHDPEPVWNKSLPDVEVREDEVTTITIPDGAVFDPDGDPLVFGASRANGAALPDWLTFDPVAGELVAEPGEGDPKTGYSQTVTVRITATEDIPGGASTSTLFDVEVEAVNDAPEVVTDTLVADEGREDAEYAWSLPTDAFSDEENDPLDFEIRDGTLPDWLKFDPRTGRFTSDDPEPFVGDGHTLRTTQDAEGVITHWADYEIRVGAVDSGDAASENAITVTLAVAQENDAPTVDADVAAGFADHVVRQDDPFVTVVPEDLFVDPEGDVFTLEATGPEGAPLPDWLSFDGAKFSGIPGWRDVGEVAVQLTATDTAGATSTVGLSIVVDDVNDAPVVAPPFADVALLEGASVPIEPAAHFVDPEGDPLSFNVAGAGGEPLPSWLAFDADENRLEVVPGADAAAFGHRQFNTIDVEVTAFDSELATTTTSFAVEIEPLPDLLDTPAEQQSADTDHFFDEVTLTGRFTEDPTAVLTATRADGEPLPDWLQFDPTTGAFTGTPTVADIEDFSVRISAVDAAGHSDSESFRLEVEYFNTPPFVRGGTGQDPSTDPDDKDVFTHRLPQRYFDDPNPGDELTIEARLAGGEPLPAWLSFDPDTLTFEAMRENAEAGPLEIELTATDEGGLSVTSLYPLDVRFAHNRPPLLELEEPTLTASAFEDQTFRWSPDATWFHEEDEEPLHFEATLEDGGALPAWLKFDPATGALTGTPSADDAGTLAIELWALDPYDARSSVYELVDQPGGGTEEQLEETPVRLELEVRENMPPVWAEALDDRTVTEDAFAKTFEIPVDAVLDPEDDPLVFSAHRADGRELPDWLSFDPGEREFVALPTMGDPADGPTTVTVRVTAREDRAGGETASTTFDLTVEPVNDAPDLAQPSVDMAIGFEGQAYSWQVPNGVFVDEEGYALDYAAALDAGLVEAPLPAWLRFDAGSGTFWTDSPEPTAGDGHRETVEDGPGGVPIHWAHYDLLVTADDGAAASAEALTLTLKVRTENDPPVVNGGIENQEVRQHQTFPDEPLPPGLFTDADGDVLTLSASLANGDPLPDWLDFDGHGFSGKRPLTQDDIGQVNVRVTATDGSDSASTFFAIRVHDVNDAPTKDGLPPLQTAPAGSERIDEVMPGAAPSHVVAFAVSDHFADPDVDDRLTVKVARADASENEPRWVTVVQDGDDARIELRPLLEQAEQFVDKRVILDVWVEDKEGAASDPTTLNYYIDPLPLLLDAPAETLTVHQDNALEDAADPFVLTGRYETLDEADVNLTATRADGSDLPDWLSFDPESGAFTGTPGNADVEDFSVRITATDAAGHEDVESFKLVVEDTNDAPVAVGTLDDASFVQGEAIRIEVPALTELFDDPDLIHGDELTLSSPDRPDWLHFDAATSTFIAQATRVPDVAADTDDTVTLRATDQAGAFDEIPFTLTITPANQAPEIAKEISQAPVATEGQPYEWRGAREIFDDEDQDDASLELTARSADNSSLPGWLDFNENNATFSGTPGDADPGSYDVRVTATDKAGASVDTVLSFEVKNVNDAPVVGTPMGGVAVAEGAAVAITLPEDLFIDADLPFGDDLDISAPGLPSWLAFDATTGELTGTAPNVEADSGYTVTLRATDNAGKTVETSFAVDVAGTNDAPQVTGDLTPPGAAEDAPFSWTLPAGLFTDPEGGAVTLSAGLADGSPLPAWLGFDAATRTFTGVPSDADIGSLQLRVTAADHLGATTSVDATLDVANVNDKPEVTATIAGRSATVGEAMAPLTVTGFFTDADLPFGDTLTFTAGAADGSPLPEGLVFDGTTLSGTATAAGQHMLRITATDDAGESVAQDFRLTVDPPAGAEDPLEFAADGTVPMSVLGGEAYADVAADFGSGSYYYAQGETYWEEPEIDYWRYSKKSDYQQDHIAVGGDETAAVLGNDADNIILGNDGANVIVGQGGADTLYGAGGDDALYGGAGDDVLVSGTGSNELHGGAGDDRYEIGGHGAQGLREGDLDTIFDADGANVVDFDGVTADRMSFGMDGADLFLAVDGADALRVENFNEAGATFDVHADDAGVSNGALLSAVEEMRAAYGDGDRVPLADVLDGYLGEGDAHDTTADPIAAFLPGTTAPDAAATTEPLAVSSGLEEPAGTFLTPNGMTATTEAAAAGLATKPALEEEPAYG